MTRTLIDFSAKYENTSWYPINDVIMGGRSESNLQVKEGIARFIGNVSLLNNGGFASVRSEIINLNLSEFAGISITARGDGKVYKCNLRTDTAFDGILYQTPFQPKADEWNRYDLPFTSFFATFRGRELDSAPPLDTSRIISIGLMISEKQAGPFSLEIREISAYWIP
jgi:NADH dehydrogenase [ubiquinone] 1 alpha subcomplex assembly factor 1